VNLHRFGVAVVAMVERWPGPVRWALPLGWAGLLWWASDLPSQDGDATFLRDYIHNGGHVAAYAILATLLLWALPERGRIYLAPGLATLYGVVDELHQSQVIGRACSVGDLLSDACGAFLAVLVIVPLQRRRPWSTIAVAGWVVVCLMVVLLATLME